MGPICPECGVEELDGFKSHLSDCPFWERKRKHERALEAERKRYDRWDHRLGRELRASLDTIIIILVVVIIAMVVAAVVGGLAE